MCGSGTSDAEDCSSENKITQAAGRTRFRRLFYTENVNRIAYLARFQREKMRKSWMKMKKTKTISVINKEICCK